ISIDNQLMQWVFSNEAHMYRFTGCNFGSPQRFLRLHFTDPSSGWTDDLPLAPTSWQNQEILAQLTLEVKGGKVVPMPDINSLEIQLIHESIPGKLWVLGKGKFRAVRGNPVPLMDIPQALIAAFPQGSPYVLVPVTNFYGVSGAMGIVRPFSIWFTTTRARVLQRPPIRRTYRSTATTYSSTIRSTALCKMASHSTTRFMD